MDLYSLPKAELHVHLEGSVEAADTRRDRTGAVARRDPARYHYHDFMGFLDSYKWVNGI